MTWKQFVGGSFAIILISCLLRYWETTPGVVLYCAQDQDYAEVVLKTFEEENGLKVTKKYDTEAAKSVSLYQELVKEKGHSRCDVFWNNEILSTIRLARLGLLQPYESPAAASFRPLPTSAQSRDHSWHPFAARARVLLINRELLKESEWPRSLLDLTQPRYRGQVVMAKPWAGTSATQAVCLFEVLGADQARTYYQHLADNQIHISPGNQQAAEWVGRGQTPSGKRVSIAMTDTDDAMGQIQEGRPVQILFPDRSGITGTRMGTLFIPNTLAILKDCPHPQEARRLVDYLLEERVETRLAEGGGFQIPLNPHVQAKLPAPIEHPPAVKAMEVDFERAVDLWEEATGHVRNCFDR